MRSCAVLGSFDCLPASRTASIAMTVPASLSKMTVFGLSLAMALSLAPVHRPLSVVELWCGVASIAKAAECAGYANVAMDRDRIPGVTDVCGQSDATEDILTKSGFLKALKAVLEIKDGGLLWMAPVCSSFVFLNSAKWKRTVARPQGRQPHGTHGRVSVCSGHAAWSPSCH